MTENIIYMGVNAPKIHQRIIGQLMMRLGMLFYIAYIDSIGVDLNDLLK